MDTAAAAQKPAEKPNSSNHTDGDHDSGVDESTQRKDGPTTNGDLSSPSKSPSKIPAPKKLSTLPSPTKSTKASPKTPEAPPTAEKKKVPMNKIQVGAAPSPNLKTVKSKIGSLQNATHKPGGGNVKIEHRKLDWKAEPRIAAKNDAYQPGGGDKKIPQVKLKWEAKPKVGSLENATHKPGGGEKKIESVKLDFKDKAKPKVGSKDNIKHTPGGGNVKTPSQDGSQDGNPGDIEDQKLEIKASSKIGSLDNVKHKPGGGDRKIFDDKEYLRQMSGATSRAGSEGIPSGTQDGWSSASTSRRTSRDRRTSGDRRYRSESRLGLRTPEPRMGVSPKEEHCSLWEKHERDTKVLTREEENLSGEKKKTPEPLLPSEQKLEEVELITPENLLPSEKKLEDKEKKTADPVSPSELNLGVKEKKTPEPLLPSEQTYPKSSVEEKDQNSNKPASYISSTDDTQKSKPSSITKLADQKVSESSGKEEGNKAEKETKEGINDKKEDATKLKDPIKIPGRPQPDMGSSSSATLDPKLPTIIKEENANTQAGLDAARNNSKQLEQNQNAIKKPESKEDMVREIKEIDSKEVRNQNGTSSPLNNVNNKSNQPSDKVANANLNQTSNESTSIKNQSGAESKLT